MGIKTDHLELLKEILENLPGGIRTSETKILSFTNTTLAMEAEIQKIEHSILSDIIKAVEITEVNDEKKEKKKYPNQTARDIELNKRLGNCLDYAEKKKSVNSLKEDLAQEKIKLNFLQNKFSAAKYLTRLFEKEE